MLIMKMKAMIISIFVLSGFVSSASFKCHNNQYCIQDLEMSSEHSLNFHVCRLTCGVHATLWPLPTGAINLSKKTQSFQSFTLNSFLSIQNKPSKIVSTLSQMIQIFEEETFSLKTSTHPFYQWNPFYQAYESPKLTKSHMIFDLYISLNTSSEKLRTSQKEGYSLKFNLEMHDRMIISIISDNIYGCRHALETLSQLIVVSDDLIGQYSILTEGFITDQPAFSYRGLMIDTSRNFISVPIIKNILRGLSFNKMNILHWHFSDTTSFPIEFFTEPNITKYGSMVPETYYTQKQIQELIQYAKVRGIQIIPELDLPSHAGAGWNWEENLSLCYGKLWTEYCYEPPCGQLNPVNSAIYPILTNLYEELSDMFQESEFFHMGGDEVSTACWNSSDEIQAYLLKSNLSIHDKESFLHLWKQFQDKAFQLLALKSNNKVSNKNHFQAILWSSDLTDWKAWSTIKTRDEYVLQVWSPKEKLDVQKYTNQGYRVIISNSDMWYLDCGFGNWISKGNSWCDPYKSWKDLYDIDLFYQINETKKEFVLGGEAPIWTELVDDLVIETRIWPRTAAIAERLWSNLPTGWKEANSRMQYHRHRLVKKKIITDALQPKWCLYNDGQCF